MFKNIKTWNFFDWYITFAFSIIMFLLGILSNTVYTNNNYYPKTGIITEINETANTAIFTDKNGHEWKFEDIEDYEIGDIISVIMDGKKTMSIYDDKILAVNYSGTIENFLK